jgi:hypothetical protein
MCVQQGNARVSGERAFAFGSGLGQGWGALGGKWGVT